MKKIFTFAFFSFLSNFSFAQNSITTDPNGLDAPLKIVGVGASNIFNGIFSAKASIYVKSSTGVSLPNYIHGIFSQVNNSASLGNYAFWGTANGTTADNFGIYGYATNSAGNTNKNYGIYGYAYGIGTGVDRAAYFLVSGNSNGTGDKYGIDVSNEGTGIVLNRYGANISVLGNSSGASYGISATSANTGNGSEYGGRFTANGSGSGTKFGISSTAISIGNISGISQSVYAGSVDGDAYGLSMNVLSSSTGDETGISLYCNGATTGTKIGEDIHISGAGISPARYGSRVNITGSASAFMYGYDTYLNNSNTGSANTIGNNISVTGNGTTQTYGVKVSGFANGTGGVSGGSFAVTSTTTGTAYGVFGVASNTGGSSIGGSFSGTGGGSSLYSTYGVSASASSTSNSSKFGVSAQANQTGGTGGTNYGVYAQASVTAGTVVTNYGVYAEATGAATTNVGIYARAAGGTNNTAGVFVGNVNIAGALTKTSGTFKIDHPLDPANKYLYHSFVESPDMMNIYNGNIITDENGNANISLPTYFEALNIDFRYQLTCIGQFAQAIISEKVKQNQFKIKTDKPNVEVSWQVTGVRNDVYAKENRVVPEVEKPMEEKGTYIYPKGYAKEQ
jgi:hypothetical protein